MAAHEFYPEARVEFKEDYFMLYRSPDLIPAEATTQRLWSTR